MTSRPNTLPAIIGALLLLFIAAYALPWVTNPYSSLTLGAFDLAEWMTLDPRVRLEQPELLTPLLLRLPPLFMSWLFVFLCAGKRFSLWWWIASFVALAAIAALLPPLEFITDAGARADTNYQQQFVLALVFSLGSLLALSNILNRWHSLIAGIMGFAGIATAIWGLQHAYDLLRDIGLAVQIGAGGPMTVMVFAAAITAIYLIGRGSASTNDTLPSQHTSRAIPTH